MKNNNGSSRNCINLRSPLKICLKTILVIHFTFVLTGLFAQGNFRKAFVIKDNDTISGYVDYTSPDKISTKCFFRKDSTSQIINYSTSDIQSFYFDKGKIFVARAVTCQDTTRTLFLEFLLKGVVNLYYCNYQHDDYFYIEKDGIMHELSNNEEFTRDDNKTYIQNRHKYIGHLKWLLKDADALSDKIERTGFDFLSLIDLLKDYHNQTCGSNSCVVYYKKEKTLNDTQWKIKYGFSLGSSFNQINLSSKIVSGLLYFSAPDPNMITTGSVNITASYLNFQTLETNTTFNSNYNCIFPALFVNFSRNSNSSYQIELKYNYLKYPLIDFNEIEIPLMYNYDFLKYKKVSPFVNIGFSNILIFGTRIRGAYYRYNRLEGVVLDTDKLSPVYSLHNDYVNQLITTNDIYHFSLNLGCGLGYSFSNKNAIRLEFRYQTPIYNSFNIDLENGATYKSTISMSDLAITLSYVFN